MAGPTQIRLDAALSQVIDSIHTAVTDATGTGGLLDGIKAVVKGDRSRVRPDTPYLFVTTGGWRVMQGRALHHTYELPVLLTAFVLAEEPEDGWMDAQVWAARAQSVVLADRSLGLAFVEDTQPAEGVILGKFPASRKFAAAARLNVRISIVEAL